MADSSETPRPDKPRDPNTPPAYLPRLSYPPSSPLARAASPPPAQAKPEKKKAEGSNKAADGDAGPAVTPKAAKSKKKKEKPAEKVRKPGELEETPNLDTYDTRRKIRLAAGTALTGVFLICCFFVYRWLVPSESVVLEGLVDEGKYMPREEPKANQGEKLEAESRTMLEQAELSAKNGNTKGAVALLEKVKASYPRTAAAKQAQEALERPKHGLPLFVEGPAVAAKAVAPAPAPPEPPKTVVNATEAQPTAPAESSADSNVQIVLPPSPAEPRKEGNVERPKAEVAARPMPPGFRARPEAGVHPSGWPLEIVGERDGATMVLVPGGSFTMGQDGGERAEAPAHHVTLATYYIDQHEVTVRQYSRFLQETGRNDAAHNKGKDAPQSGNEGLPQVRVSARDAQEYARWAGKSLPTEAQWEMAARTPDGRMHPWGSGAPTWDPPRVWKQIDPVMSCPTDLSPYGAYDLAGNAWEWTADWFDPKYYQQFRTAGTNDPIGPPRGKQKPPQVSVRGGSKTWESTWREGFPETARMAFIGFRCALMVEHPSAPPPVQAAAPPGAQPAAAPPGAQPAAVNPNAPTTGQIPF